MKNLALLILLSALPLSAHADANFTFGTPVRGYTLEVRPGVHKTEISIEKARDVTFQHEAGLPLFLGAVPYSTTERRGDENACANAKNVALVRGMNACVSKYAHCAILRVSKEEGERYCKVTVFTQGEGGKKIKSASLEESGEQEEFADSQDAA